MKVLLKTTALCAAAVLCITSLCSCSFGKKDTGTPTAATQTEPAAASPDELIVGKWEITDITDKDGQSVNLSDVDLSGTPLESYSSVIGMVLKKGASIEFKADKTIPLVITNGEYEIDGDTLSISIPSLSDKSIKSKYEVSSDELILSIGGYKIALKKKSA